MLYDSHISDDIITNPWVIHIACLLILIPIGVMFMLPIMILWYVHIKNILTNATTSERFGKRGKKKKMGHVDSEITGTEDGISTTTSLLAERLVENIGKRPEVTGSCGFFQNCF